MDTESPPPTIVVLPWEVIVIRSFKTAVLPPLNYSISNAPYGPFQTTLLLNFRLNILTINLF